MTKQLTALAVSESVYLVWIARSILLSHCDLLSFSPGLTFGTTWNC